MRVSYKPKPESRARANESFVRGQLRFDTLIGRLIELREANFGANEEAPHWGDVGSLDFANQKLTEALEHYGASTEPFPPRR